MRRDPPYCFRSSLRPRHCCVVALGRSRNALQHDEASSWPDPRSPVHRHHVGRCELRIALSSPTTNVVAAGGVRSPPRCTRRATSPACRVSEWSGGCGDCDERAPANQTRPHSASSSASAVGPVSACIETKEQAARHALAPSPAHESKRAERTLGRTRHCCSVARAGASGGCRFDRSSVRRRRLRARWI